MIGSDTAIRAALRRLLACVLACVLALAGVPSVALAELSDGAGASDVAEPAEANVDQGTDAGAPDVPAAETPQADAAPAPAAEDVRPSTEQRDDEPPADTPPADDAVPDEEVGPAADGASAPADAPDPETAQAGLGTDAPEPAGAEAASPVDDPAEPAGVVEQDDQDGIQLAPSASVTLTVRVIGPDADGTAVQWIDPALVTLASGASAWDASVQAFAGASLAYDASESSYGVSLDTITSPLTGAVTGWDGSRYWQLFVDGAVSDVGASSARFEADATITWYFSSWGEGLPAEMPADDLLSVYLTVIGTDADGAPQTWLPRTMRRVTEGTTAADLTKSVAGAAGLALGDGTYVDSSTSVENWYLNSIASPETGEMVGWDGSRYWRLFVDGAPSWLYASGVTLRRGTSVTWCYAGDSDVLAADGLPVSVDATAARPELAAEWVAPQRGNVGGGAVTSAPTPTASARLAWADDLKDGRPYVNFSTPVIAAGHVYLAVGSELRMIAAGDGSVVRTARLAAGIGYNGTIAYAEGVVVVPLEDGRIQALTADALATVWIADPFGTGGSSDYVPTPVLAVDGAYAYVTRSAYAADWSAVDGRIARIALADGATAWVSDNAAGGGYYWNGITFVSGMGVATDGSGRVFTFSLASGDELGSFTLANGAFIRSAPVSDAAGNVYVSAYDGTLYKLRIGADGSVALAASVSLGTYSIAAPTIVGGNVYVGGAQGASGLLAVVNASTLAPVARITGTASGGMGGPVNAAPLVSVADAGTYAYFTSYATPGSVFRYRLGDAMATTLFAPTGAYAQYCSSSVVADAQGALYYLNDADVLFKLTAVADGGGSGAKPGGDSPAKPTPAKPTPAKPTSDDPKPSKPKPSKPTAANPTSESSDPTPAKPKPGLGSGNPEANPSPRPGGKPSGVASGHAAGGPGSTRSASRRGATSARRDGATSKAGTGSVRSRGGTRSTARGDDAAREKARAVGSANDEGAAATHAATAEVEDGTVVVSSGQIPGWAVAGLAIGLAAVVGLSWWLWRLLAGRAK